MRTSLLALAVAALAASGCTNDLVCPSAETACGDRCFALDSDPLNCGACGHTCGDLQVCEGSTCACAPDVAACTSGCADLRIDPANCGTCGTACGGATPVCDGDGPGCVATGGCVGPEVQCDSSCVDLGTSPSHCGSCGHACAAGQACISGQCGAPVHAACYWTNQVKPLTRSLRYGGQVMDLGTARPFRLALVGHTVLAAAGQPQASLSFLPVSGGSRTTIQLPGSDLEGLSVFGDVALVSNAGVGTLDVLDLDGTLLDEIPLPHQQEFPNPMGVAASGTTAYVALNSPFVNQIAKIDLSGLAACRADSGAAACGVGGTCAAGRRCVGGICKLECGSVAGTIDLAVPGATDGGGVAAPTSVAIAGGKVYVTVSNIEYSHVSCDGFEYDWYSRPAGAGRLAQIDPDALDTVSVVNLGDDCKSPSGLAVRGSKLWVSCGAYCWPDLAPGAVLPVDLSGLTPSVGAAIPLGATVGGPLAFCGSDGYVTDQRKTGAVVRFDPDGAHTSRPVVVCGADSNGNALASDIVCSE